jgi:hypothetical protein
LFADINKSRRAETMASWLANVVKIQTSNEEFYLWSSSGSTQGLVEIGRRTTCPSDESGWASDHQMMGGSPGDYRVPSR